MRTVHIVSALLVWIAAGCSGFQNSNVGSPGSEASQNTPVIEVAGTDAYCDLGRVRRKTERYVIFAVRNDDDKPLCILKIRGDCEYLLAVNPPDRLEPRSVTEIKTRFTAPDRAVSYRTRLVLVTDNPLRKYIMLNVHARITY